jgi:hypothetical protein
MSRRYMSIEQAMQYCKDHHVFLHHDDDHNPDVWSCGRKLPITLRRSIVKHRQELLSMMEEGDVRVCPNPMLHKVSPSIRCYTRIGTTCAVCRCIAV